MKRISILIVLFSLGIQSVLGQQKPKIPATNGAPTWYQVTIGNTDAKIPCSLCTPDGWTKLEGTPDVGTPEKAGAGALVRSKRTIGGGAKWLDIYGNKNSLPLPPNGHRHWITMRNIGTGSSEEESVKADITNLIVGREYEIILYLLTATTGVGDYLKYYGRDYLDKCAVDLRDTDGNYLVPRVDIQLDASKRTTWETKRIRHRAIETSERFTFYPGHTHPAGVTTDQPVNISVSLNAVNEVPLAESKTKSFTSKPVTFKVIYINDPDNGDEHGALTSDKTADPGCGIQINSVDLDPSTAGIQTSVTTDGGTWVYSATTGEVTFTPKANFYGEETFIYYTVKDAYTIDGNAIPATSNEGKLTVVNNDFDEDGVPNDEDLDDDNDGILDTDEQTCSAKNTERPSISASANYSEYYIKNPSNAIDGNMSSYARMRCYGYGNTGWIQFQFSEKLPVGAQLKITYKASEDGEIRVSNNYDGTGRYDTAEGILPASSSVTTITYTVTHSRQKFEFLSQQYTSSNLYIYNIEWIKDNVICDADGDGIPNYLDLDSDGDGCPDVLEANANLKWNNLASDKSIDISAAGTNGVNSDGVPNGKQAADVGTSQDKAQQAAVCDSCDATINPSLIDSDGDGIADDCDLDDDNDGILDTDEGCKAQSLSSFILQPSESVNGATGVGKLVYKNAEGYKVVLSAAGTHGGWDSTNASDSWGYAGADGAIITDKNKGHINFEIYDNEAQDQPKLKIEAFNPSGEAIDIVSIIIEGINNMDNSTAQDAIAASVAGKWSGLTLNGNFLSCAQIDVAGATARPISNVEQSTLYGFSFTNMIAQGAKSQVIFNNHDDNVQGPYRATFTPTTPVSSFYLIVDDINNDAQYGRLIWTEIEAPKIKVAVGDCELDSDGDGIPNRLDLDSDDDGCPDALEANKNLKWSNLATNKSIDISAAGTNGVNSDGVPNGKQATDAGTSQDKTQQADVCDPCDATKNDSLHDSDGDGIGDVCDLDDDNDGILDTDEGCETKSSSFFKLQPNESVAGIAGVGKLVYKNAEDYKIVLSAAGTQGGSDSPFGYAGADGTIITDKNNGYISFEVFDNESQDQPKLKVEAFNPQGASIDIVSITFWEIHKLNYGDDQDAIAVDVSGKWSHLIYSENNLARAQINVATGGAIAVSGVTQSEVNKLNFSNLIAQGAKSEVIFNHKDNSIQGPYNSTFTPDTPVSSFHLIVDDINGSRNVWTKMNAFQVKAVVKDCLIDTDGDGVPNALDLDSDNDGCSDAKEGAKDIETFVEAAHSLEDGNDGVVRVNLGNDVNADGIPVIATGGQGIGSSQKSLKYKAIVPLPYPFHVNVCENGEAVFNAKVTTTPSKEVNYQWQVSTDNGTSWGNMAGESGTVASGGTATLRIGSATMLQSGNKYRVFFNHENNLCGKMSVATTLTVYPKPKFTVNGIIANCYDDFSKIEVEVISGDGNYEFWLLPIAEDGTVGTDKIKLKETSETNTYQFDNTGEETHSFVKTNENKKITIKLKQRGSFKVMMKNKDIENCECYCN